MVLCKGKRSKRPRSAVFGDSSSGGGGGSPASSSSLVSIEEDDDVAHCLMLLARGGGGGYECKTCCRRFPSFQALGGHRASHNKKQSTPENQENQRGISGSSPSPAKKKIHGCSICGSEFFSGQALGGHMRRHRPLHMNRVSVSTVNRVKSSSSSSAAAAASSSTEDDDDQGKAATCFTFDLNLPAPHEDQIEEEEEEEEEENDDSTPESYVFSGGPGLVECHN